MRAACVDAAAACSEGREAVSRTADGRGERGVERVVRAALGGGALVHRVAEGVHLCIVLREGQREREPGGEDEVQEVLHAAAMLSFFRMSPGVFTEDRAFLADFEACAIAAQSFDHAAHVRLAYVYLCESPADAAAARMKAALLKFLAHHGVDAGKYHETITRAWIMAVAHFMARSAPCPSAAAFMAANPELLDSRIMLTHYSARVLFSPEAREGFVEPDIQDIPRH